MTLFAHIFAWRKSQAARTLSLHGHKQRRDKVREVARQLREELGLPDDARLA